MTINNQKQSIDNFHQLGGLNGTRTIFLPPAFVIISCYYIVRQLILTYDGSGVPMPTITDKVLAIFLLPFAACTLLNYGRLAFSIALTLGGYAIISLAGALSVQNLGVPQPESALYDLVRDFEFPVFFLGFLYFCDRDVDPSRTLQLISWFYITFATLNLPFLIRDLFSGGISIYGQSLVSRLGFWIPQGFFAHKVESSWACFVAAACAAYLYSIRPTFQRAMLVTILSIMLFIHLSAKECMAFLLIGLIYLFRKAVLSPTTVFAAIAVCGIVGAVVLLSPIGDLFELQYTGYVAEASGAAVRTELTKDSIDIANRYFPLGSGGGTFASPASAQLGYSQLYVDYGLNTLWGAAPDAPMFLYDVFWPKIIAQSGWIGSIFFIGFLWTIFSRSFFLLYRDQSGAGWLCFSIAFSSLIFSTAIAVYTNEFLEIANGFFAAYAFSSIERGLRWSGPP